MSVNLPLLRRVLDHITTHSDQHDQYWWAEVRQCGTVMCIAGHTCVLQGHRIDFTPEADGAHLTDGRRVEDVAAELLGLDLDQSLRLFRSATDLQEAWAAARYITADNVGRMPDPIPK